MTKEAVVLGGTWVTCLLTIDGVNTLLYTKVDKYG